jgi:rSAM/selenodomain-associated transferase 1
MKTVCMILKAPREGTVKTRLGRDIGPERATAIYRALVEHQMKAIPPGWDVAVHFAPPDAGMEMEAWLRPHLSVSARFTPQCDGDLGHRLTNVVRTEFQHGAKRVFLIGGDCPGISHSYLADADRHLNEADVVIGPATDGGYVLLGLKAPHTELFEHIAWGTHAVLEQTLTAAKRWPLSVGLLPTLEDIDDAASLERQSGLWAISL